MYNDDTELLFPSRVITALKDIRGAHWAKLVEDVEKLAQDDPEHLAFVLMMTTINGCKTCNSDSFRAMRGCTQCSILNVRRFRGDDSALMKMYKGATNSFAGKNRKEVY